jgi:vacuolar protein sorting-associated protein 13A/C
LSLTVRAPHTNHVRKGSCYFSGGIRLVAPTDTREMALEVLKIIGTADLLGNPIGLLSNYATGVKDFFYEPAHAMFTHPVDIGEGLLKGTGSLLKNSVGGTANTVSKVTGVFGKGVAALSMDDAYLLRRKQSKRRARMHHDHLGHGVIAGVEGLGKGVLGGEIDSTRRLALPAHRGVYS